MKVLRNTLALCCVLALLTGCASVTGQWTMARVRPNFAQDFQFTALTLAKDGHFVGRTCENGQPRLVQGTYRYNPSNKELAFATEKGWHQTIKAEPLANGNQLRIWNADPSRTWNALLQRTNVDIAHAVAKPQYCSSGAMTTAASDRSRHPYVNAGAYATAPARTQRALRTNAPPGNKAQTVGRSAQIQPGQNNKPAPRTENNANQPTPAHPNPPVKPNPNAVNDNPAANPQGAQANPNGNPAPAENPRMMKNTNARGNNAPPKTNPPTNR